MVLVLTARLSGRGLERVPRKSVGGHVHPDERHARPLWRRRDVCAPHFDAVRAAAAVVVWLYSSRVPRACLRCIHGLRVQVQGPGRRVTGFPAPMFFKL